MSKRQMERRNDGSSRSDKRNPLTCPGKAGAMTRTEDNDTFSRPRMDLTGSLCRIRQREAAVRQGYDEIAGFGLKYLSFLIA